MSCPGSWSTTSTDPTSVGSARRSWTPPDGIPDLAALCEHNLGRGRASFERVVRAAMGRRELPEELDVGLLVDALRGPIVYRRVVLRMPVDRVDIERLLDLVLEPHRRGSA